LTPPIPADAAACTAADVDPDSPGLARAAAAAAASSEMWPRDVPVRWLLSLRVPCLLWLTLQPWARCWSSGSPAPGPGAQECFCRYPASAGKDNSTNATLPEPWEPAPEVFVPEWLCVSGFRQYQCMQKLRRGRSAITRGLAPERRAPEGYCNGSRVRSNACQAPGQMGFSISFGPLGAVNPLVLQITCPSNVNCSNASAFLSASLDLPCSEGPFPNVTVEDFRWIATAPSTTINSPAFVDGWQRQTREPFAYNLEVDGDTLLTISPWRKTARIFLALSDGTGHWNETPTAEYRYNDEPLWVYPVRLFNTRQVAMSSEAILTQFAFHSDMSFSFNLAEQAAWEATGQKMILLPRGTAWGSQPPVTLAGLYTKAGFGISGDTSGGYTIVGSLYNDRHPSIAGTAQIFERAVVGTWGTAPVIVIGSTYDGGYPGMATFGHMVAIDAGSPSDTPGGSPGRATALVSGASVGSVYVFQRGVSGWSTVASARLYRDVADAAFPVAYGYPSSLAISGAYVVVSGVERAWIYSRRGGLWTDPPFLLAGFTGAGALFASSTGVADLGGGRAVVAVGALGEQRAFLFERDAAAGTWAKHELSVGSSYLENPQGFGRSVGVGPKSVAVGSDVKKVFMYTKDIVGLVDRTYAMPLEGHGPQYTVSFDARLLKVGAQHKVCIDLGAYGSDQVAESFKEVGLRVFITWASRHYSAEEL